MYRLVVFAVVLVFSAADAAPWPTKPIEIALEHPRGAHHRTMQVEIDGVSHSMLFDTGGGVTAISPTLAKQLNCQTTATSIGLRMTGERVETPLCRDIELRVGGLVIHTEAAVIDLAGMLGKDGPHVDGMVSLATLDGFAVSLDLAHDKVTIESARSLAARTKKATAVPFRRATGLSGGQLSPFAGVASKGGTVWVELDSGHLLPEPAVRPELPCESKSPGRPVTWSPWTWLIRIRSMSLIPQPSWRRLIWVPSPQSKSTRCRP